MHSLSRGPLPMGPDTIQMLRQLSLFQPVTFHSLSETLSHSACIITGGSERAVTLADALHKAVGALDMVRD